MDERTLKDEDIKGVDLEGGMEAQVEKAADPDTEDADQTDQGDQVDDADQTDKPGDGEADDDAVDEDADQTDS